MLNVTISTAKNLSIVDHLKLCILKPVSRTSFNLDFPPNFFFKKKNLHPPVESKSEQLLTVQMTGNY